MSDMSRRRTESVAIDLTLDEQDTLAGAANGTAHNPKQLAAIATRLHGGLPKHA